MTPTKEQQQALDELMMHIRKPAETDMFKTWLGFSQEELRQTVLALLDKKVDYQRRLLDWVEANPLDSTLEIIGIASLAFYQAEKNINPRIHTFTDAFYYISTCASVGYADIFAVTQAGRAIAALVMLVGPALTNNSLNRPTLRKENTDDTD
jgi:hypothetical protein